MAAAWIFWIGIYLIFYTYIGYMIFLWVMSLFFKNPIKSGDYLDSISIIIPAYNEERQIGKKLDNCLQLDYPGDLLEIIVVSDCSTDSTDEIVSSYADRGIRHIRLDERKGKHYAQHEALKIIKGEIVVFTDVSIMLSSDSLRLLMRDFNDPKVGCVSSVDDIESGEENPNAEGMYIRYDMLLRKLESVSGSSTGMSGSFYAARRTLCELWYPNMSNDFYMPLLAVMKGYRAIVDENVKGRYSIVKTYRAEFIRKVRTVVHGLQVLFAFGQILKPIHYGLYWYKIISHKMLRWLVPFLLIIIFISNAFLLSAGVVYQIFFAGQLLLYFLSIIGGIIPSARKFLPIRVAYFFVVVNLSILVAWFKYLSGEKYTRWEPSRR
jgi:glycosyltransferase involved in cell wall biosynthesis